MAPLSAATCTSMAPPRPAATRPTSVRDRLVRFIHFTVRRDRHGLRTAAAERRVFYPTPRSYDLIAATDAECHKPDQPGHQHDPAAQRGGSYQRSIQRRLPAAAAVGHQWHR